jgi:hypothetical protein
MVNIQINSLKGEFHEIGEASSWWFDKIETYNVLDIAASYFFLIVKTSSSLENLKIYAQLASHFLRRGVQSILPWKVLADEQLWWK